MIIPTFFFVGILVALGVAELRRWLELMLEYAESSELDKDKDMPDCVKHMYS